MTNIAIISARISVIMSKVGDFNDEEATLRTKSATSINYTKRKTISFKKLALNNITCVISVRDCSENTFCCLLAKRLQRKARPSGHAQNIFIKKTLH